MKIDDNIYPVVSENLVTTYTNKILDYPLNQTLDNNIVYSVGVGNYACNSANVIINYSGASSNSNVVLPLYSNQYAQNLLLKASIIDGFSPHDSNRLYETRMGYGVDDFPKYNNLNLYDLRLIRGFAYYSEMACIYVTYQTNNNPLKVSQCDLKTYQTNFSDKKILNVFVKIWAGAANKRWITDISMTKYDNRKSIYFSTETETVSDEIINYTVDVIRTNSNTISPSMTDCVMLLGLVDYDTYYRSVSQIINTRAGTIFYNSNFNKLNWNEMINLSNDSKPCYIPNFQLTAFDCYHLAACLGILFTPDENIAKSLDLTKDENISNIDLFFPVMNSDRFWAGAYTNGENNRDTEQYKNKWNADKNAPFENGSPSVSSDSLIGDDKLTNYTGSTTAFTHRYLIDNSTMQKVSTYINNVDDNLFTAIIDNMKMSGSSPINSIVSVSYVPIDISSYAPVPENIVIGTNYINTGTFENPVALQGYKLVSDNIVMNLGSCKITDKNKNYLAYEPYTKYIAYIPYCNFVELEPSIILNNELKIELILDLVAGSCEGVIRVNGKIYKTIGGTFSTQCSVQGLDSSNYINGVLSSTGKAVTGIATTVGTVAGLANGGISASVAGVGILAGAGTTASAIYDFNTTPKNYQATGKSIGLIGQLMPQHVCIYKYSCSDISDENYGNFVGYACEFSEKLSNLSGFTVCANALVECNATNTEKEKIKELLENGVYL